MKEQSERRRSVFGAIVLAAVVVPSARLPAMELESGWSGDGVVVDGRLSDWPGTPIFLGEARLKLAALNDGEFLYVSVSAEEGDVRDQILRHGLTLWFDPAGGDERVIGVRYPVGFPDRRRAPSSPEAPESAAGRGERSDIQQSLAQMEVVGGGNAEARALRIGEGGVEVAVGLSRSTGKFYYELKIPLRASGEHPWAIGVEENRLLGFGLVSPRRGPLRTGGVDFGPMEHGGVGFGVGTSGGLRHETVEEGRPEGNGDEPEGLVPGRVGGLGGERIGPEPFEVWLSLELARPAANSVLWSPRQN